jgi:hypothetical protein
MSKGINKHNEEKLRIYLSKQNDIKPGNQPDKKHITITPPDKKLSDRVGK